VNRFVLDASTVLTWCFPDEEAQKAEEISERIAAGETVIVPAFWRHEVLNALLVGERRKRLTSELIGMFIVDLSRLPVNVDNEATREIVFDTTLRLCRKHGLTAYDAAYLEIAIRGGFPLATADQELKRAAGAEAVQVL
jgi:predicted nucleic acid-binding protein